jgi:phospho-N-acetylmuramoyl-pentapeptide-transferase
MLETLLISPSGARAEAVALLPVWLRAAVAGLVALLFVRICSPAFLCWATRKFREPIRSASPRLNELMAGKQGTPTLGGLLVLAGWLAGLSLLIDWHDRAVLSCVAAVLSMAALGFVDDWIKLRTSRRGMSARAKLGAQIVLLAPPAYAIALQLESTTIARSTIVVLGVLVGAVNAVNLTDGLDGLAAGSLLPVLVALGAAPLVGVPLTSGGSQSAIAASAELAIVAAALVGALVGFMPLNTSPARVFLGNTGSLALGGALGSLGALLLPAWLLAIAAGLFVIETASVILQVAGFKASGRRLFRCAPLHHHFQFLGWSERRIVRTFWGVSVACVLVACGLAGLPNRNDRETRQLAVKPVAVAMKLQDRLAGDD